MFHFLHLFWFLCEFISLIAENCMMSKPAFFFFNPARLRWRGRGVDLKRRKKFFNLFWFSLTSKSRPGNLNLGRSQTQVEFGCFCVSRPILWFLLFCSYRSSILTFSSHPHGWRSCVTPMTCFNKCIILSKRNNNILLMYNCTFCTLLEMFLLQCILKNQFLFFVSFFMGFYKFLLILSWYFSWYILTVLDSLLKLLSVR